MEFTLADQTVYFLFSLLFGVILSALYDFVVVLKITGLNKLWQTITFDVLYMFLCAVLTVLFAMPFNKGEVRYFVLFGEIIGFFVYRYTLGSIIVKIYSKIIRFIWGIIEKSLQISRFFLHKVLKVNRFVVYNVGVILYKAQNIVFRMKRKSYEHKEGN